MTDYTANIGGSTTMMIRDLGGTVEFWVKTGSQTYNYQQPWGWGANGVNSGTLYFRMLQGGQWQKFGEIYVGYNQTVRFTLVNSGLGFPSYDFYQAISRTTVPQPPYIYDTHAVSASEIYVEFSGTNDGGSPVLEWQIGYGSNPNGPDLFVGSGGGTTVGGFSSGQRVYFWTRARNAIGWSGWSSRTEATTWKVPDAPSPVSFSAVKQTSLLAHFTDGFSGGPAILERQFGYGKVEVSPTDFWGAVPGPNDFINLDPGKTYYFWARSRNTIGWGAWSAISPISLIAGARVLVGSQWKRAVPYVKHAGVWKVARPWIRDAGVWKESTQ